MYKSTLEFLKLGQTVNIYCKYIYSLSIHFGPLMQSATFVQKHLVDIVDVGLSRMNYHNVIS